MARVLDAGQHDRHLRKELGMQRSGRDCEPHARHRPTAPPAQRRIWRLAAALRAVELWPPSVARLPGASVPLTSVRCALGYRDLVDESARSLRMELPNTRLAYRTTNAVCDARFDGNWAVAARAYHCAAAAVASLGRCTGGCKPTPECMDERLSRVQASCQRRYNATMGECVSTFMDAGNSKQQRDSAKAVLEGHGGGITLFDAFALTESRCDATVDGRHYPRLLASINERWLTAIL